MMSTSPVLLQTLGSDMVTSRDLVSLKHINFSGASSSGNDIERIQKKKKAIYLFQSYGMSEGSCMMTPPRTEISNSSVGCPLSNCEAKIIDADSGKALGPGDRGELCYRGPQIMKGYLKNPLETSMALDEEGWLHTGDLAYYDDQKNFYIVGRVKEMIKVKGFQVAPVELESVLRTHPDILDAGVIGLPHYKIGEIPAAFIVPRNSQSPPLLKDIRDFMEERLASYKVISHAFYIEAIPKNTAGKILRKELKNLLEKQEVTKNSLYSEVNIRPKILS